MPSKEYGSSNEHSNDVVKLYSAILVSLLVSILLDSPSNDCPYSTRTSDVNASLFVPLCITACKIHKVCMYCTVHIIDIKY